MNFIIVLVLIIIGGTALDQLTKFLVTQFMELYETVPIIKDVLHITYIRNEGAAFGMLKEHRWVFMTTSAIAIITLGVYLLRFCRESKIIKVGIALIISGGIGNMIDRIFLGYVVDMIDFRLINFYVFNVADSCVCVGAGAVILGFILGEINAKKLKKSGDADENNGK